MAKKLIYKQPETETVVLDKVVKQDITFPVWIFPPYVQHMIIKLDESTGFNMDTIAASLLSLFMFIVMLIVLVVVMHAVLPQKIFLYTRYTICHSIMLI